jgi:hypothetical protein
LRSFCVLALLVSSAAAAFCSPAGILESVKTIQIDPTVIEQPDKVKDAVAADLVRYDLRAAIRDALFEEGISTVHAHFVLDEFSRQGASKRLADLGTGRSTRIVEGRLVIQDANGGELASIKIHVRGSVAFDPGQESNTQGHKPASDLEKSLLAEIEKLK